MLIEEYIRTEIKDEHKILGKYSLKYRSFVFMMCILDNDLFQYFGEWHAQPFGPNILNHKKYYLSEKVKNKIDSCICVLKKKGIFNLSSLEACEKTRKSYAWRLCYQIAKDQNKNTYKMPINLIKECDFVYLF